MSELSWTGKYNSLLEGQMGGGRATHTQSSQIYITDSMVPRYQSGGLC